MSPRCTQTCGSGCAWGCVSKHTSLLCGTLHLTRLLKGPWLVAVLMPPCLPPSPPPPLANQCRAQLAQVLATGLPPIGAQGALLAQVLLGQLLRLPASPLPTCAYVTLIVDLCKLMPVFAKYYAGGVRRLFERCDYLDPQVSHRLSQTAPCWQVATDPSTGPHRQWVQLQCTI